MAEGAGASHAPAAGLPRGVGGQGLWGSAVSGSSDEGDTDGDGGGLAPLGRLLGDEVLHHRVFGHVLHKVGLLHRKKKDFFF